VLFVVGSVKSDDGAKAVLRAAGCNKNLFLAGAKKKEAVAHRRVEASKQEKVRKFGVEMTY
jgi:hypothetical protein